jgi:hypothetical protein
VSHWCLAGFFFILLQKVLFWLPAIHHLFFQKFLFFPLLSQWQPDNSRDEWERIGVHFALYGINYMPVRRSPVMALKSHCSWPWTLVLGKSGSCSESPTLLGCGPWLSNWPCRKK